VSATTEEQGSNKEYQKDNKLFHSFFCLHGLSNLTLLPDLKFSFQPHRCLPFTSTFCSS